MANDNTDLLKYCRYYKGENDNPFTEVPFYALWVVESKYVQIAPHDTDEPTFWEKKLILRFPELIKTEKVPLLLQAMVLEHYTHYFNSDDGFVDFMKKYYIL